MRAEHNTASPDLGFVSSDSKIKRGSPEVVLAVEVVKKAGGGHAGGESLVPHPPPRCTSSIRVALAMQLEVVVGPQLIDQTSKAQAPTVFY